MPTGYEKGFELWVPCKHEYNPEILYADGFEFLSVYEDYHGFDNYSYECPYCGEIHRDCRVIGTATAVS